MTQTDLELKIMSQMHTTPIYNEILNDIAFYSGYSKTDILSKKRNGELVSCRRLLAYFSYEKEMPSYSAIGRKIGINHATVLHHVNLTKNSINQAKPFEKKLYKLISNKYEQS